MQKIFTLALTFILCACASEVVRHSSSLSPQVTSPTSRWVLLSDAAIEADSSYNRIIPGNTEFVHIGTLPEGKVLKPTNTVLTIEGKHMHEVYIVIKNNVLIGFYMPVEKSFAPLTKKIHLNFKEISK
ncbi:MAG: hypothetical protein BWY57_01302 [Betaproteobacteria bacterium ADurb.Bin341]|nr:MAG: hypothetical protein BWY57_01302 [Betaproteobacteria bacterium ADurb.Bin341]